MPEKTKSVIFCVHAHQPIGNFDHVFEEAYNKSYKPFFDVVEAHPKIKIACHFSGCLLDWLENKKPEYLAKLKRLVGRGQLEFIGGGYYEPIYGLIPERDLVGQIQMMEKKLGELFGAKPEGAWLTERVWDTHLAQSLRKTHVEYTILDDLHFEKAGKEPPITGYFQVKQGKNALDVFASMKQLRYLMPFRKAEETIEFIHSTHAGPEDVFVFADDCEKFGMWPNTYDWVYKEKWLDQMLTLFEKDPKIKLHTFSSFRKQFPSKGSVTIPHASYAEMMEWSGGWFYNFFKKYPESRYMRDRMWTVSQLLEKTRTKKNPAKKWVQAKTALYKSQCNCSYWHGVFGGLYLHHLRSSVFENTIKAGELLVPPLKKSSATIQKLRLDSGPRFQIRQKKIASYFNPHYGACLEELDYLPQSINLTCNLQRHKEAYHQTVLKKDFSNVSKDAPLSIHEILGSRVKDLEKHLVHDRSRRNCLLDHFFEKEIALDEWNRSSFTESGDFVGAVYKAVLKNSAKQKEAIFSRKGVLTLNRKKSALSLQKKISPKGDSTISVCYTFKNSSPAELKFTFGAEFNFSIGEMHAMKGVSEKGIQEWILNDSWRGIWIKLGISEPSSFLATPIETISESEFGLEKTYQELAVLLQKDFCLKPNQSQNYMIDLQVGA